MPPRGRVPKRRVISRNSIFAFIGVMFILYLVFSEFVVIDVGGKDDSTEEKNELSDDYESSSHDSIVNGFIGKKKALNLSNLGSLLFEDDEYNEDILAEREPRNYKILIWKHYNDLAGRHLYNYKSEMVDPLKNCSVFNCIFSGNSSMINDADAVVVHLHRGEFPNVTERNRAQRWIFLSDESPGNTFARAKKIPRLKDIAGIFNWSMTYRTESDIPVPYGRVVPLVKAKLKNIESDLISIIPHWEEKNHSVLATALVSHCVTYRMNYTMKLKEYMDVDIYGSCSDSASKKSSCPGYFRADCSAINKYLFYLSFENSRCHEYITEKVYYNAYTKGAIPVIMGPPANDCKMLLPPSSYIHVSQFKSPKELAEKLIQISKNERLLLSYHKWRNDFEVLNEHGYFKTNSVHYCRICEALNYNSDEEKVYSETDLKRFLDRETNCEPALSTF